jgi:hypothetical protein
LSLYRTSDSWENGKNPSSGIISIALHFQWLLSVVVSYGALLLAWRDDPSGE